MPTYQYACTECGHGFEAVQSFSEDALTECPACTGRLRKVFSSVGIVFKGSGFYRTDSREAPAGEKSQPSDKVETSASEKSDKSGTSDKAAKPTPSGTKAESRPSGGGDTKPVAKPASSTTGSAA